MNARRRRANAGLAGTLLVPLAVGCASLLGADFDHPAARDDAGVDSTADADLSNGDIGEAGAKADAVPTPDARESDQDPGAPAPTCSPVEKVCGTSCVRDDDPRTGCASASCAPCAEPIETSSCTPGGACAVGPCSDNARDCLANTPRLRVYTVRA